MKPPSSPHPASFARLARVCGRMSARGFTLIELMVALLAGLIVSVAVVGLSKQAMNTFHEEARNETAESSLRMGVERLRADLARAAFLGTGNIVADDQSLLFGGSIPRCIGAVSTTSTYVMPGLQRLAGIHLYEGAATVATQTLEINNGLAPDKIDIGGNFTTGEDYVGYLDHSPPAGDVACGGANPQIFHLDMNTATGWRLASACGGGACTATAGPFFNAFHPGTATTTQYIVRIADNSNPTLFQYAVLCASNPVFFSPGTPNVAALNIDPATPIGDTANSSGNCKLKNWDAGKGLTRIAGVQVVRWDVVPATTLGGLIAPAPNTYGILSSGSSADPNNYVLIRYFVDGHGNPDFTTLEVIAEYVIDVKYAFSVDTTVNGTLAVPGAYVLGSTPLTHLPFESAAPNNNGSWAFDVSSCTPLPGGTCPQIGPQRIRSVRVRLVTRTSLPDRSQPAAGPTPNVVPLPPTTPSPYLLRYCVGTTAAPGVCAASTVTWARARTDITEVALPNQKHFFY